MIFFFIVLVCCNLFIFPSRELKGMARGPKYFSCPVLTLGKYEFYPIRISSKYENECNGVLIDRFNKII